MSPTKLPPPLAVLLSINLPSPIKAAAGLAVQALEDARALPNRISELPISLVTALMQRSLQAQQQYTELVTKGEQLINTLRGPSEDVPEWATFDEDLPDPDLDPDPVPPRHRSTSAASDRDGADIPRVSDTREGDPAATGETPVAATKSPAIRKRTPTATRPKKTPAKPKKAPAKAKEASGSARRASADRASDDPASTPLSDTRKEPFNRVRPAGIGPGSSFDQQALADLPIARRRTRKPKRTNGRASDAAPVDGFKDMTLPQIRARVKSYDAATLRALIDYEKADRGREPVLKILDTRLAALKPADERE